MVKLPSRLFNRFDTNTPHLDGGFYIVNDTRPMSFYFPFSPKVSAIRSHGTSLKF